METALPLIKFEIIVLRLTVFGRKREREERERERKERKAGEKENYRTLSLLFGKPDRLRRKREKDSKLIIRVRFIFQWLVSKFLDMLFVS